MLIELRKTIRSKRAFKAKIVNVVFIGPPRSGKTSVLQSVLETDEPLPEHSPSTGIIQVTMAMAREGCIRKTLAFKHAGESLKEVKSGGGTALTLLLSLVSRAAMQTRTSVTTEDKTPTEDADPTASNSEQMSDSSSGNTKSRHSQEQGTDTTDTENITSDIPDPERDVHDLFEKGNGMEGIIKELEDSVIVHLFDTGGQPEFMELLPQLLSARGTVFVVCFKDSESLEERYLVEYVDKNTPDAYTRKTLSPMTTKETIFQCISSAIGLSGSENFSVSKNAVFIATHIDQTQNMKQSSKKKDNEKKKLIEEQLVHFEKLRGGHHPEDVKFIKVCTEQRLIELLRILNRKECHQLHDNEVNYFFQEQHGDAMVLENHINWIHCVEYDKGKSSFSHKSERVKHVVKILQAFRGNKVKELMQFSGIKELSSTLNEMIKATESIELQLGDYILYYALATHKGEGSIPPIVTLEECLRRAKELGCVDRGASVEQLTEVQDSLGEPVEQLRKVQDALHTKQLREVQDALHRLDKQTGMIKYGGRPFTSKDKMEAIDILVICDPQGLYKSISEMVCRVYLDEDAGKLLRYRGELSDAIITSVFKTTIDEIAKECDVTKDRALKKLVAFFQHHNIMRRQYQVNPINFVPSALCSYPVEIKPKGKGTTVPSLVLVPKLKYLVLGILPALMTKVEKDWNCSDSETDIVRWTIFRNPTQSETNGRIMFRNMVKYHVDHCVNVLLIARATGIEIRVEGPVDKAKAGTFVRI